MSKKKKVILVIVVIILLALGSVAVWQAGNIKAVINSFNYTDEELTQMIEDNKKALEEEIKEKYNIVGDFTEEEEQKIMSGELTVEEATALKLEEMEKKRLEQENGESGDGNSEGTDNTGKNTTNSSSGTVQNSGSATGSSTKNSSSQSSAAKQKTDQIVSNRIVEFYSLKAYYLGQLGQLEAQVMADYAALPASKKNLVGKQELVSKYMSVATSLLSQCDAKVASLTAQLEKEIKAAGGDTSIISTIKSAYENEKNLKKSYYLSKMK